MQGDKSPPDSLNMLGKFSTSVAQPLAHFKASCGIKLRRACSCPERMDKKKRNAAHGFWRAPRIGNSGLVLEDDLVEEYHGADQGGDEKDDEEKA